MIPLTWADIKVGGKYRIRSWKELEQIRGCEDDDGDLWLTFPHDGSTNPFTREMKYLCGALITVRDIVDNGRIRTEEGYEFTIGSIFEYCRMAWELDPWMLKHAE